MRLHTFVYGSGQLSAEWIVNGKPYSPGPAPRLSVFVRDGKKWQIVAHANFNPLNG